MSKPSVHAAHARVASDANRVSQSAQYGSGVLLHNWYEDRFAPKAGTLADVYPMPPTTYQAEFTSKSTPIRSMLRTGDLGKEILFGQGNLDSATVMPSVTYTKYDKMKQQWSEMRDPELAGNLVTTKHAVDTQLIKECSVARSDRSTTTNLKSTYSQSFLRDHELLSLRSGA